MNNLDIWTIEFNNKELDKALSNIKKDGTNILYTNCFSELKIGEKTYLARQYDTCIYNYEKDVLILIRHDDNKTNRGIREYLHNKNVLFHEIRFNNFDDIYEDDDTLPKIWFAKDEEVLKTAIKNSQRKGIYYCTYYPNIDSELIINYQGSVDSIPFESRTLKGLIQLKDKHIFIMNQANCKNMSEVDIITTLFNQDMITTISREQDPKVIFKSEEGCKTLCKKI